MTNWTEDDKEINFEDLVKPVIYAIKQVYILDRRGHGICDVKWVGPDLPKSMRATCPPYDKRLTAESLRYDEEEQGRDPLEVIIGIAVQLGIEQGRRIHKKDLTFDIKMAKLLVQGLEQKNEN